MVDVAFPVSFRAFHPEDCVFKVARAPQEIEGFWRIRRQVFLKEQELFVGSDRDEYDDSMIPIVCVSLVIGMEDEVLGVVRIDEREPGIWFGGRLGISQRHRHGGRLSRSVRFRNHQPMRWPRTIGSGLVYKAVSTAFGLGCRRFFANVQAPNVHWFERLHWHALHPIEVCGVAHVRMEVDLDYYAAARDADSAALLEASTR